jgi:anti-sigma B factor antagonist
MNHTGKIYTISLEERLDAENVNEFKVLTKQVLDDPEANGIVINFENTKFIDSIGLGALVSFLKATVQLNIKIALCKFTPQVKQIFELTRLYRLFDIFETINEAEDFLNK